MKNTQDNDNQQKRELAELWTLLNLARKLKHESDGDINCNWCSWYNHQRTGTKTEGLRIKRTRGDYPNYSIVKISQNTEKSPDDLRRLVTQNQVKNHQLTQM